MYKTKIFGWLLGALIVAVLSLSLLPTAAGASPLLGITDTPMPSSTLVRRTPTSPPPKPPSKPQVVDLVITKRVDVDHAHVGDLLQYTLEVNNPNGIDIANVSVTDHLPEVVDFISTNTPQGTYNYEASNRTLTYALGTLTAGQTLQITIVARVNHAAAAPDQFNNVATLSWGDGQSVTSNAAVVVVIPGTLPTTGEGPGWGEIAVMAGGLLTGLAGLGVLGYLAWRLLSRRLAQRT